MTDRLRRGVEKLLSKAVRSDSKKSRMEPETVDVLYGDYKRWVQVQLPDYMSIHKLQSSLGEMVYKPTISLVLPIIHNNIDDTKETIDSVLGLVYDNWELIVVTDTDIDNDIVCLLEMYAAQYSRITLHSLVCVAKEAEKFDAGVRDSSSTYIAIVRQGDVLWPNALYEVAIELNKNKKIDFLYTDEDQIPSNRHDHIAPFLKPDYNVSLLESIDYMSYFSVIKKKLYLQAGGVESVYDAAFFWDLSFRLTQHAKYIRHVPKVVYSRRLSLTAQGNLATEEERTYQKAVLRSHVQADDGKISHQEEWWDVKQSIQGEPLISIIIPTINQYKTLRRCIDSIITKTTYRNYEIILVDTGTTDSRVLGFYKKLTARHSNIYVINWAGERFSYAKSCNDGVKKAHGDILVMLNNDTEIITHDWLERLGGEVQRSDVGAVGAMLLYPDGKTVQHAGIGVGLGGVAANLFSKTKLTQNLTRSQRIMLFARRDVTAVTGACLVVRREVFEEVCGFDEKFRITYNDVDLCLRLREKGYRNIYVPSVRLKHHESLTLGLPEEVERRDAKEFEEAKRLFKRRWSKHVDRDPMINENIDKTNAHYNIASCI